MTIPPDTTVESLAAQLRGGAFGSSGAGEDSATVRRSELVSAAALDYARSAMALGSPPRSENERRRAFRAHEREAYREIGDAVGLPIIFAWLLQAALWHLVKLAAQWVAEWLTAENDAGRVWLGAAMGSE